VPSQPFHFELNLNFLLPLLWLGLITSVGTQFLLYRMIQSGNLVNVTSLLYLVPVVTLILDYLILGNKVSTLALVGIVMILVGLVLVFRQAKASSY
jgi:drug/metabolite transporter (DMT)-like permease